MRMRSDRSIALIPLQPTKPLKAVRKVFGGGVRQVLVLLGAALALCSLAHGQAPASTAASLAIASGTSPVTSVAAGTVHLALENPR